MSKSNRQLLAFLAIIVITSIAILFVRNQNPANAEPVKTNSITEFRGKLIEEFPPFPVYPGSTIESSTIEYQNNKPIYTAVWQVPGKTHTEVMEWYDDEELPTTWIFDEPRIDLSPTKQMIVVSKDGWRITLTIERQNAEMPTVITAVAQQQ